MLGKQDLLSIFYKSYEPYNNIHLTYTPYYEPYDNFSSAALAW